ncbi:hypothetical protein OFY17_13390 [Marinomonas sp. C2222]|uniref:Uncharacterized protein n=1 Tax=Marinomonas sargassi TaxID=2984494 RepID=A0ABT2YVD5_9GAMM|nr:hypothetical protein [Marinomonas sargassi]MCV2403860.1 hypothetical protein [Marinomonas sargassi]
MTAIIITLLLLLIGGFIAFAIWLQLKEKARLDELRKVAGLNNELRQVRRYLDEMPPQYQPKDMRSWLFKRTIAILDQLIHIKPDASLTRRRSVLMEEMKAFQDGDQKRRAKPMNDEILITEVKRLFDSFETYLSVSQREKTIDEKQSSRYFKLVSFFKYKVQSDFHAYGARKALLSGQHEVALEMYNEALSQLSPVKDLPQAQPTLLKYNEAVTEINEAIALKKAEEEEKQKVEDIPTSEVYDDEWGKFVEDSTFKKKEKF